MTTAKLASFVDNELSSELQEVIFAKDTSGKYYLLGKYVIVNNKNICKVYCLKNGLTHDFTSLKNATAWCILDNAGKYSDSRRVECLDLRLSSIDVDIAVHKNKIKNSSNNFSMLVSVTKLQQDTYKRRMIVAELAEYINHSKRIQESNFRIKDSKIKHLR